ncbi:phosphatidylinositol 4-kinase [Paecilomyces variotii]|uniref:1-phosphatidylinositol 4-kinase n=1 Tax=Byssochlamys spectabilis TaxID=264951 RepID=A0A443HMR7_BYSSP|nr:phosphatidylinositol 4-kinase [Paecilomyces variotii]KAJ9377391.1 hypothetical protein DTO032I4_8140 [Paecilomyces variotii]RWQ93109.1 phosphatidylinositol 4-kinase [Paecilomyces variotii]
MDVFSTSVRRSAFDKLAALAVKSPEYDGEEDINRLLKPYQRHAPRAEVIDGPLKDHAATSRTPMSIRELDILLAVCKASPSVSNVTHAERLVSQLSKYLPESHVQLFRPSPFLHGIKPSPWETLTQQLTTALLILGLNYPTLRNTVENSVYSYIDQCSRAVNALVPLSKQAAPVDDREFLREYADIMSIAVSLVGFLDASATYSHFWSAAGKLELVRCVRDIFSEGFMVAVEAASSSLRNSITPARGLRDWRRYARRYAAHNRPLGSMLLQQSLMRFIKDCAASVMINEHSLTDDKLLDKYLGEASVTGKPDGAEHALFEYLADAIMEEIRLLDDGSDYLKLSSAWQQHLAFSVKAHAIVGFLSCVIGDEGLVDTDTLFPWLEDALADPNQMGNLQLATATLMSIAILAKYFPSTASNSSRLLVRFIVQGGATGPTVDVAAKCLAQTLSLMSQDAVITTLYSLGNVLSAGPNSDKGYQIPSTSGGETGNQGTNFSFLQPADGSHISLSFQGGEESTLAQRNVTHAIVKVAANCGDEKISALAQSMLLQKIGKTSMVIDASIIEETSVLALTSGQTEFQLLLKFYTRLYREGYSKGQNIIMDAVQNARAYLSVNLDPTSTLYRAYLTHLLENIINKGDSTDLEHDRQKDVVLSVDEVKPFIKPLALLVAFDDGSRNLPDIQDLDEDIQSMFRDAWFNIAVHGISISSKVGQSCLSELRALAERSPPLVSQERAGVLESDVELNPVLRRGMCPYQIAEQKRLLTSELPGRETEIKKLSYPKAVFLNATLLIETLRASSGECTKIFNYFLDPAVNTSEMGTCMKAVADKIVSMYLNKSLWGRHENFSAQCLSKQLAEIFIACCHRISRVQDVAHACADKIIAEAPTALCETHSLFTLLELLTVMWSSCLEGELDEFGWTSTFVSPRGTVRIQLSDNYEFRKATLHSFHTKARQWVSAVMDIAPLDVKGLLQTYLSDYEDDGAYGHISLGRSFALEMGSLIARSDQRLGSIDSHGEPLVNVASDFVAQYTTRQEYRYMEASPNGRGMVGYGDHVPNGDGVAFDLSETVNDVEATLSQLYERTSVDHEVSIDELREALRRAAALLCNSNDSQPSIIHFLVGIPFQIFSKESIKLGVSLWLGVIHENPRTEPRILAEVAEAWERTIRRKQGMFDPSFDYVDPFFTPIELLPTDKALLLKKQRKARNILSPHFRILQFFDSHFNATRLGSPNILMIFYRLISTTLVGLKDTRGHPLAREVHFQIVLLGLKVLRFCKVENQYALWKLKDQILSAALSWFKHFPKWSFGGNRLQMKAEDKLMGDVASLLDNVASIGSVSGSFKSTKAKQDLVQILIENERSRLRVWLFPLLQERKHYLPGYGGKSGSEDVTSFLRLAWAESPSLAVQLVSRFPSAKLRSDVRWLLLNFPEKALEEPASLEIMFGSALPSDVSFQLKYLLYWAPVNPTEALTYFLPAYGNHPFILQYAMRALESHSMDVRFFFVPQLVQALRYDALGYVERYIFETAKLSQLFAHQVIWNMKANMYKDEDSQIPDSVKPTLDRFMDMLVSSFTSEERDFYEREFSFFNEITGISGKLRPYIKRSKPEKKQKIEEELRKVKVEVGVYLPSNPDGVVVGIDRKSGKPLQSHAKAPYMATFRIRKTKPKVDGDGAGDPEVGLPDVQDDSASVVSTPTEQGSETYDVWQSAIFKVGDDCRQDVLALQMIAAFRSIFNNVGLDVWVFPYRVTATAPGCGVIDVLPNSISRDMLGREAVNGLYDYFVSKYGGEDSTRFQEARTNFVKSMASYSVISYLLQFKDRHNGNIMIDDAGHIIHIDFGFCFDIAPGGVRFERAPFKLTPEMVAVMGGGQHHQHGAGVNGQNPTSTQPYQWFESLVIKAFLASRPYSNKLAHIVSLMLDSGLPCFKPETLKNFRDRFVLEKSEREAADHMRELIRKSYASISTKGYDQFQLMTNGIPY